MCLPAFAQDPIFGDEQLSLRQAIKDGLKDIPNYYTEPFRWEKKDFFRASIITGSTIVLMGIDPNIQQHVQAGKTDKLLPTARFIDPLGSYLSILPIISFWGVGMLTENARAVNTSYHAAEAWAFSAVTVQLIKIGVGRSRPDQNLGAYQFKPFSFERKNWSMPSNHSALAFAVGTTIAKRSDKTWVKILCYSTAGALAAGRVIQNKHHTSDIVLGTAIGFFSATWVIKQKAS